MNQRKFRTRGGGVVTWTYTHDDGPAQVSSYTCASCDTSRRGVQWPDVNSHAAKCHQIP